jgi:CheY-like chemotaxis protein
MKGVKVLVVEDDPQVRSTAISMLKRMGCQVLDAYSGKRALDILEDHPGIDVLFADVRMPGMSGPELMEEARRLRPDLNMVLTSGYVGKDEVPEDVPFVPKPFRMETLAVVVECGSRAQA